jgi:hypothetical protein
MEGHACQGLKFIARKPPQGGHGFGGLRRPGFKFLPANGRYRHHTAIHRLQFGGFYGAARTEGGSLGRHVKSLTVMHDFIVQAPPNGNGRTRLNPAIHKF